MDAVSDKATAAQERLLKAAQDLERKPDTVRAKLLKLLKPHNTVLDPPAEGTPCDDPAEAAPILKKGVGALSTLFSDTAAGLKEVAADLATDGFDAGDDHDAAFLEAVRQQQAALTELQQQLEKRPVPIVSKVSKMLKAQKGADPASAGTLMATMKRALASLATEAKTFVPKLRAITAALEAANEAFRKGPPAAEAEAAPPAAAPEEGSGDIDAPVVPTPRGLGLPGATPPQSAKPTPVASLKPSPKASPRSSPRRTPVDTPVDTPRPADASPTASPKASPKASPRSSPKRRRPAAADAAALEEAKTKLQEAEAAKEALQERAAQLEADLAAAQEAAAAAVGRAEAAEESLAAEGIAVTEAKCEVERLQGELQARVEEAERAAVDAAAATGARDTAVAELDVSERHRASDALCHERTLQREANAVLDWERRCRAAEQAADRQRMEKAALEARLVDDHLREHCRQLQRELDQAREARIRDMQHATERPPEDALLGELRAKQATLEKERGFYSAKVDALQGDLQRSEREVFLAKNEAAAAREEARARSEDLERQLFLAKLAAAAAGKPHPERAGSTLSTGDAPNGGAPDSGCLSDDELLGTSAPVMALVSPRLTPRGPVVARGVEVQVEDEEKAALLRDMQAMGEAAEEARREMDEELAAARRGQEELEARLLAQAQEADAAVAVLSKQLKTAQYRANKAQQRAVDASATEQQLASVRQQSAAEQAQLQAQLGDVERWKRGVEKGRQEALAEAQVLRSRVRALQRELTRQREEFEARPTPAPTAGAAQAAAAAARGQVGRLVAIDDALLGIHKANLDLDAAEARVRSEHDARRKDLNTKLDAARRAHTYWADPATTMVGPDGETPAQMAARSESEAAQHAAALQSLETGIAEFFKQLGAKRGSLHSESTALVTERRSCSVTSSTALVSSSVSPAFVQ